MRRVIVLAAVALLALLPVTAGALEIKLQETGKSANLTLADDLKILLDGNPTTGYLWELADLDSEILAPDKEPVYTPDSSRTGAGGRFTFHFAPRKPGSTKLRLVYRRPWEKEPPVKVFEASVTVTASPKEAIYRSAEGEQLIAAFDLEHNLVMVRLPDGRSVTLAVAPSASGTSYSNGDETFWEHQGVGRFVMGDTTVFEGVVLPKD